MTRNFDAIEAAFGRVKASADEASRGDAAAKDKSFQDIFALNNEIGRLGRENPKAMPKMRELQAYVNEITVGLKYDKKKQLREGLSETERAIGELRKDLQSLQ